MKCTNCRAELLEGSRFCSECGSKVEEVNPVIESEKTEKSSRVIKNMVKAADVDAERVTLYPDGKYRWVYEYPMMNNPTLFFTCLKVFSLCFAVPAFVVFFSVIGREGIIGAFMATAKVYALLLCICVVLSLIGYLIVAASYGFKYVVVFVMDDDGVDHIQQQKQFKKAQVIGVLTALAGGAAGNVGRVGQGMLVASHGSLSSTFKNVRKIKGYPGSNVIKVNSLFSKNQVYVMDEDYDFVWEYITTRCPNAKIS